MEASMPQILEEAIYNVSKSSGTTAVGKFVITGRLGAKTDPDGKTGSGIVVNDTINANNHSLFVVGNDNTTMEIYNVIFNNANNVDDDGVELNASVIDIEAAHRDLKSETNFLKAKKRSKEIQVERIDNILSVL